MKAVIETESSHSASAIYAWARLSPMLGSAPTLQVLGGAQGLLPSASLCCLLSVCFSQFAVTSYPIGDL